MNIYEMERSDFVNLKPSLPNGEYNGFVIVPVGETHDSGYPCMKFVLVNGHTVVGCVGGYCDVVHLNGIGGYGKYEGDGKEWHEAVITRKVSVVPWNIDCMPSGFVHLFVDKPLSIDSIICSDFNIYA